MNRNTDRRQGHRNKPINNMPRNRIPRGNMQPPVDNIKTQPREIYSNPRFCDVFARLKGSLVLVQVKSGVIHEGILNTISPKGEVVLIQASTKDLPKQSMGTSTSSTMHTKLILKCTSIVKITAKNIDFDYPVKCDTFATDTEISQRVNGQLTDRKLEKWLPVEDDSVDERLLETTELESDGLSKDNGWDATEMFQTNQHKFGYTSTYKQDLKEYTTPLEEEDTKEFRERKVRAEKLAKEIEQSPDHAKRGQIENNDEMTEEERFSAVSRVGPNSRPTPLSSSIITDKYVPPQKRQVGPIFQRAGPARKPSPSGPHNTGPGRPPMIAGDRQSSQAQTVQQHFRHPHQQQAPTSTAVPTGAMPNDYNRVQPPHHSPQAQPNLHHPPHPQQPPYQQRPQMVNAGIGSRGQSPTLSPMGQKSLPSVDLEQQRIPPMPEKQPVPQDPVILRPDGMGMDNRPAAPAQPLPPATEVPRPTEKGPSKAYDDLKTFHQNFDLTSEKAETLDNKVPAAPAPLHNKGKVPAEILSAQMPIGGTVPMETSMVQPETKVASTSPISQVIIKKPAMAPVAGKERGEEEKAPSPEKTTETKLNPNAKPFIPRALPQKTPTPPPSRSPSSQMSSNHMIAAHYMPPHQVLYQPGQYIMTSNAQGMPQFSQIPKQVHQSRGAPNLPRVDYHGSFSPALAAGQPLVAPMAQGQIITVSTGGQGMQQGGHLKLQPVLNHMMKQQPMPYRAITNSNPGVSAMHPQSQQMVAGTEGGVMMPHMMQFQPSATQQSQTLQQQHQHPQGPAPSNQFMHTAPSHTNAASQMQQPHHTTPPLQQSQQSQSGNHQVIAPQGQFSQHGGRPSPGPMPQQMTHAQAQAQVVHSVNQQQGGMHQLVAVTQGGAPAIVYTSLPQSQHGIPAQHASQQYSNIPQHINQQQSMQVQPTHVPSNMANITNVTRVHPDPHPHPHPAAAYYLSQGMSNQPGMVQGHLSGSYMSQHAGATFQPGN